MFGTDGIRAFPYKPPLDEKSIIRIGYSYGIFLKKKYDGVINVFLSKDTRKSSNYIEKHLIKGINLADLTVIKLGILPTASLSIFAGKYPGSAGIMVTASHNDHKYNGIKFLNPDGEKITKNDEKYIIDVFKKGTKKTSSRIKNINYENSLQEYTNEIIKKFQDSKFRKFKLAIDLSNGASFRATPIILSKLKIDFKAISVLPNGLNINKNCGVENYKKIGSYVKKNKFDFGVAIDGDADRIVFVDKNGRFVEGDKILNFMACNTLKNGDALVTTVMTNNILDTTLKKKGISVIRTDVGDKNVYSKMKEVSTPFGGENSGHYIFRDHLNTSDANLNLLLILKTLSENELDFDMISKMKLNPSILRSLDIKKKKPLSAIPKLQNFVKDFKKKYKSSAFLNIRYSGTENKIRILVQYHRLDVIHQEIDKFEAIVNYLNYDKT
jgi:phosphoglucosamine mutase